jgi:hypothetical protein
MGDRANVYVVEESEKPEMGVYLYTHWSGTELPLTLQVALRRGESRWSDGAYLTRIIFSEMIKDEVMSETGYGISPYPQDGETRVLKVVVDKQEVSFSEKKWSFNEYIELGNLAEEVWRYGQ